MHDRCLHCWYNKGYPIYIISHTNVWMLLLGKRQVFGYGGSHELLQVNILMYTV